jgi:hypothetical protein
MAKNSHARRETKQKEAIERNARWAALSTAEKIAALKKRPGNCAKQLAKLLKGGSK